MTKENTVRVVQVPFKHLKAVTSVTRAVDAREVPVKEAKAKLTELIRAAEAGERIVLTRHGKPVADLVPHAVVQEEKPVSVMERYEAWKKEHPATGIGWISHDFDDQLPEDFLLQPLPDGFDERLAAHEARFK